MNGANAKTFSRSYDSAALVGTPFALLCDCLCEGNVSRDHRNTATSLSVAPVLTDCRVGKNADVFQGSGADQRALVRMQCLWKRCGRKADGSRGRERSG